MGKTEKRKLEHLEAALKGGVEATDTTMLEDVKLIHRALPELNLDDVSVEAELFGVKVAAPIIISAITGGHKVAAKVNETLAKAAQSLRIAMGVGSQRAALEDPRLEHTYRVARDVAPDVPLIANVGATQLLTGFKLEHVLKAIKMIDANALAIHLNPAQEALQEEGTPRFKGVLDAVRELVREVPVPVIVKEVGSGVPYEDAVKLERIGVEYLDVAGLGGTSWPAIEGLRLLKSGNSLKSGVSEAFRNWGIPTAASICEAVAHTKLKVIASGGIRSGVNVAKALSLGAIASGVALPLLKPAYRGDVNGVIGVLKSLIEGLKVSMFLMGVRKLEELRASKVIITGKLAHWLSIRAPSYLRDKQAYG